MKKPTEEEIKAVVTERAHKYGNNFPCIASKWSNFLKIHLTESDVARMMALLKECRLEQCPNDWDTILDYHAYLWIAEHMNDEYAELSKRNEKV